MRGKLALVVASIAVLVGALAVPALTVAKSKSSTHVTKVPGASLHRAIPVTGSGEDGAFKGKFKIAQFEAQDGKLVAIGRLKGIAKKPDGSVQKFDKQVTMPATLVTGAVGSKAAAAASCRILTLTLGPLDLNLLGLRVQLNQVNLRITGEQGPGNLLGNLLCAVAGLLNP